MGCPCVTLVLPSLLFKLADVEKEKGSIVVVGIVGILGVGSGWKSAQHEVGGQPDEGGTCGATRMRRKRRSRRGNGMTM